MAMPRRETSLTPEQLRAWRRRLELTQVEAAKLIGVSIRSYSLFECGDTPISKPIALACWAVEVMANGRRRAFDQLTNLINYEIRNLEG